MPTISKTRLQRLFLFIFLLSFLLFVSAGISAAADAVGRLTSVTGKVDLLRGGRLPAVAARVGDSVFVRDFVRTKSNARAEIRFNDANVLRVAPRSRIDISEYAIGKDRRSFRLSRGRVEAIASAGTAASKTPKRFEISTPNAVAGVRGTWFFVFFDSNTTGVAVKEGTVYAYNSQHTDKVIDVPAGFTTLIRNNNSPDPTRPATDAELTLVWGGGAPSGDGVGRLAGILWVPDVMTPPSFVPPLSDTNPAVLGLAVLGPAVEVGLVNMTGTLNNIQGVYNLTVDMTARFLATSSGASPTAWKSSSMTGSWVPTTAGPAFNPVGSSVGISGNGPNGSANVAVGFTAWNTGTGAWTATVSGSGTVNSSNISIQGNSSGSGATGNPSGNITGSAAGTAGKM